MWCKNIAGRFFGLVTKHVCNGRTDRQNYDSQNRASIPASDSKYGGMAHGRCGHWLVWMDRRPAGWSVCLPLLIFPCTIKSRSSLLAPAHPGGPGKKGRKTVVVVVVVEGSKGPKCDTMPNFTSIGQTVAQIWPFFNSSRWRSPPSWIFKMWKF